jgi:hypothetical protein
MIAEPGAEEIRMLDDAARSYYQSREQVERAMARKSDDPAIRQVHQTLADSYRQLLEGQAVKGMSQRPIGWSDRTNG